MIPFPPHHRDGTKKAWHSETKNPLRGEALVIVKCKIIGHARTAFNVKNSWCIILHYFQRKSPNIFTIIIYTFNSFTVNFQIILLRSDFTTF